MERFEPFTLGQCPFCNGGVTAAVRRFDERTIGMWYVASDYDPTPAFRRAWARDVRMFHMRPACPRCGRLARLRSGSDFAMGCPRCGLWAEPERRDEPESIMSLVEAWGHLVDKRGSR